VKAIIVLPALNESKVILKVLEGLPKRLTGVSDLQILVVDDGSTDNTYNIAKSFGANVLKHTLNRGLGAAIKTGLTWAKGQKADIAVTFDSDGQHYGQDIPKLIGPILKRQADLVIGSRFAERQDIPLDRRVLNSFANLATFLAFGVQSSDSQSGLRAFSKKAMELVDFQADRMEFSSEILVEAKRNNLKVVEVPSRAIYTEYSRTKGQKNLNAIPVFVRLLIKFLR